MDPEFSPGSEHVAHCPVTNPTAKQWTYDAELYLVKDDTKYASSGIVSFTLAAGAFATVDFPITMPGSEGTYNVYLDIYVAGDLIAAYQATEDVVVVVPEKATLIGNVDLQGRPATDITVRFFEPGTNTVVLTSNTTTDSNGNFTVTGIAAGTYDVCVKGYTSLSILKANEFFTDGEATTINFGTLLEGDANGDDWITWADYKLFQAAFHTENPECDFNRDGYVDMADYVIWSFNFGKHGDCAVPLAGNIAPVLDREILMNKEISLAISWTNESEITMIGRIALSVECPDGKILTPTAIKNQDKEAAPGYGYTVEFEPFISSMAGTYIATATLSPASEILDSITFKLVAPLPPQSLPEGFEIDILRAEPPIITLGNKVKIHVWWFCPNPGLIERTFSLHCIVDGATLQRSWGPTTRGNGAVDYYYTPYSPGSYTAQVLNRSVSFEVIL